MAESFLRSKWLPMHMHVHACLHGCLRAYISLHASPCVYINSLHICMRRTQDALSTLHMHIATYICAHAHNQHVTYQSAYAMWIVPPCVITLCVCTNVQTACVSRCSELPQCAQLQTLNLLRLQTLAHHISDLLIESWTSRPNLNMFSFLALAHQSLSPCFASSTIGFTTLRLLHQLEALVLEGWSLTS